MASKTRILVTGLSLLDDAIKSEDCFACDYDVGWIFRYPSTLIWADSIVVSPTIVKLIKGECSPYGGVDSWGKIARMFFEVADRCGIIEIRDPVNVLPSDFHETASKQAAKDRELLYSAYPNDVKISEGNGAPGEFTIRGQHYCSPRIHSLYFSIVLAKIWRAQLLLDLQSELYLQYRLGLRGVGMYDGNRQIKAFSQVFAQHIPEIDILPPDAYRKCHECKLLPECKEEQLSRIETNLRRYAEWRDYDEIHQMKKVFNDIANRVGQNASPSEIVKEFRITERKLKEQLKRIFPEVSRWSKLVTMVSIPVIVAGVTTGEALVAGLGAGIAGIAQTMAKYVEILRNKNSWVCFKQSDE